MTNLEMYALLKNFSKGTQPITENLPEINAESNLPFIFQSDGTEKSIEIYGNENGLGDLVEDSSSPHYGEYEISVAVSGKNLVENTASTQTVNGVTFTVNEDKSITINGTATSVVTYYIHSSFSLENGYNYVLSSGANLDIGNHLLLSDPTSGLSVDISSDTSKQFRVDNPSTNCHLCIFISAYNTITNLTLYPMIKLVDMGNSDYTQSQTFSSTVYSDSPLFENDKVVVPIQTLDGDNLLLFKTGMSPFKISIKAQTKIILYSRAPAVERLSALIDRTIASIDIPNGVTKIGQYVFRYCSSLTSVTIPNSVTSIEVWAFADCSSLTSIEIPDGTTNIGVGAFYGCRNLTNVTIPNSVTSIENYTFHQCWNLTSVEIPNNVTNIGKSAFYDCRKLTNVTIPNSVTNVESDAFLNCTLLENVTLENGFACNGLNLSSSTKFSVDTMIAMFNALADRTGQTAYTLIIGSTNLAKLSNEQIAIATQKNWTLA